MELPRYIPEKPAHSLAQIPCWVVGCPDPWGGLVEPRTGRPKRRSMKRFERPGAACDGCYEALAYRQKRDKLGLFPVRRRVRRAIR